MDYELLFSMVGLLAGAGWLLLVLSPLIPTWSDRLAGYLLPAVLAGVYVVIALQPNETGGGFGSFAEVAQLFTAESAVMAGWIHFLAFDLAIGAWICRTARAARLPFWFILPTLPLTFLFGPAGFLAFILILGATKLRPTAKVA